MGGIIIILMIMVIIAAVIFHVVTRYSRRGRILSKIPGPIAYPFVGNLLKFNVNTMHEFWQAGREITKNYYPITRFWLCRTAVISVRHPDDIQILFSSPKLIDKGYIYDYLHPWLKTGLLTSTGSKWRQRRKILTPAFHWQALKKYLQIVHDESCKIVDELKNETEGRIEDIVLFCAKSTLKVICESAMGVRLDTLDSRTLHRYERAVHDIGKVVLYRMPRPYLTDWMMKLDLRYGRIQRKALNVLHRFTEDVVNDRRSYHQRSRVSEKNPDDVEKMIIAGRSKQKLAMLDLLLAAENDGLIDAAGIQEEVDTFTFEAHDTTAMAMSFTLMLLAENPRAQELARNEVVQLFDRLERCPSLGELQELDYLERCIKESLRLFPPVATLMRYTPEDLQLKHALVPADSHIMIHLYDTHRDPYFWQEPDRFEPDRFLPEENRHRHPFSYVPFSAGPRNCIGQKFAMMELKLLIGQIIYNYRLEPIDRIDNMKLMADIVLRPVDPVKLKFTKIIRNN